MTRALVTQMQSALEGVLKAHRIQESRTPPTTFSEANAKVDAIKYAVGDAEKAITAACEYLATEPIGERAELIADLRRIAAEGMADYASTGYPNSSAIRKAADMLEADVSIINEGNKAQQATDPSCPSCQSPGLMYECVYCSANSYPKGFAQQAKRVPMSDDDIDEIALDFCLPQSTRSFARAIEAHRGITPEDDEPEDLYALALKADNLGQP